MKRSKTKKLIKNIEKIKNNMNSDYENKKHIDYLKTIVKKINTNSNLIIIALTILGFFSTIAISVIGIIETITFSNVYNLNYNLIDFKIDYVIGNVAILMLLSLCFILTTVLLQNIINFKKNKIGKLKIFLYTVTIFIFDIFLSVTYFGVDFNIIHFLISFVFILGSQFISILMIYPNKKNSNIKEELKNYFKLLPFYLLLLIIIPGVFLNYLNILLKTEYEFISDEKVIVYTSKDYYIVQDYELNNKQLIIYTNSYQIIETTDIIVTKKDYDSVKIEKNQ